LLPINFPTQEIKEPQVAQLRVLTYHLILPSNPVNPNMARACVGPVCPEGKYVCSFRFVAFFFATLQRYNFFPTNQTIRMFFLEEVGLQVADEVLVFRL